jgi:hypothetical protein
VSFESEINCAGTTLDPKIHFNSVVSRKPLPTISIPVLTDPTLGLEENNVAMMVYSNVA